MFDGQWFPRQAIQFEGAPRPLPSGGGGYSCTMTAGDFAGLLQGYSDGSEVPTMGSIDAEPLPGHTLIIFINFAGYGVAFRGNAVGFLAGKTVWVGGVSYPFDGDDWTYDAGDDFTYGTWVSGGPTLVDGNSYLCEFKP